MTNRDLLKEAIADAKVVKETAIANAKLALEETFNPFLKERLAAVLAEMDENEEELEEKLTYDEKAIADYGEIENVEDFSNTGYKTKNTSISKYGDDETEKMGGGEVNEEDMDLEELLRELEEMDSLNEAEDLINNRGGAGNLPKSQDMVEEEAAKGVDDDADGISDDMDADVNIEEMNKADLEDFIKDVILDMVDSGELEAGHEGEEGEEEEEEEEGNEGEEEGEEEEIDIEKMVAEIKKAKAKKEDKDDDEKEKMKKELKEAYDALRLVKSELNEVNLFNAKLLYTNKIFRNKNLSESQKVKVLAAFDKAVSVKEAKLVYETLSEGLKTTKTPVNESLLRGAASKVSGIAPKKPILEVNDQVNRWQLLAGIKKQL
jgi:hypothetical protein